MAMTITMVTIVAVSYHFLLINTTYDRIAITMTITSSETTDNDRLLNLKTTKTTIKTTIKRPKTITKTTINN